MPPKRLSASPTTWYWSFSLRSSFQRFWVEINVHKFIWNAEASGVIKMQTVKCRQKKEYAPTYFMSNCTKLPNSSSPKEMQHMHIHFFFWNLEIYWQAQKLFALSFLSYYDPLPTSVTRLRTCPYHCNIHLFLRTLPHCLPIPINSLSDNIMFSFLLIDLAIHFLLSIRLL